MFFENDQTNMKEITSLSQYYQEGIPVANKGPVFNKRRALFSASSPRWKKIKASMTIEAAIVLPLFLFFVIAFSYFLIILSLQADIQLRMEEASRQIGTLAYFAIHSEGTLTNTDVEDVSEEDGGSAGILSVGINPLSIKALILKDGLTDKVNHSRIKGGTSGVYVYHSSYDMKSGILDIVLNYTYDIPFLPDSIGDIRFVQRSRSHVWTGKELKDTSHNGGESEGEGRTVYVTPYGTVYHLSTECHYLDLSVHEVSAAEVEDIRNKDGGKYYMCSDCCKKGHSYDSVYVTDYGTNWHSDLHCTGLKRTVEEIDISEVGNMHACPKCGGEH